MKSKKRSLLASGLCLLLSVLLLAGSTFAWFTDSVSNTGNTIQAGNLKVDLYWFKWDKEQNQFVQVGINEWPGTGKMSAENWEPGQSDALLVRVDNMGSLASKVKLSFDVTEDSGLSDALWFNVKTGTGKSYAEMIGTKPTQGPVYSNDSNVTCMSELDNWKDTFNMVLEGQNDGTAESKWRNWYLIEYGMYADAGNQYMNGALTADIHFEATQATVEEDGFGNSNYDEDAYVADFEVKDTAELNDALNNAQDGDVISLAPNMTVAEPITIEKAVTIEGNGAIFTDKIAVKADGVVLRNLHQEIAVSSGEQTAPISTDNKDLTLEDCVITRTTQTAQPYGLLVNVGSGKLTAKNTVFTAPYDPQTAFSASPSVMEAGEVDLDGCTIATDGYGLFAQHVTTGTIKNTKFTGVDGRPTLGCLNSTLLNGLVFDGCTFEMGNNSMVSAGNFTIKNSTFDFTNTPADGAGNGINIYAENGPIILDNNTFILTSGKRGINLTSASWAPGELDASQVVISGNVFTGNGDCAIKISSDWSNALTVEEYASQNTLNGNTVTIE